MALLAAVAATAPRGSYGYDCRRYMSYETSICVSSNANIANQVSCW